MSLRPYPLLRLKLTPRSALKMRMLNTVSVPSTPYSRSLLLATDVPEAQTILGMADIVAGSDDLTAIGGLSDGIVVKTDPGSYASRSVAAGTNVTVTNGNGVSGNPTVGVSLAATTRVLGRKTAGAGASEELTLSEVLEMVGSAANGDILYRTGGAWNRLAIGAAGRVLTVASGLPSWATTGAGDMLKANNLSDVSNVATSRTNLSVPSIANLRGYIDGLTLSYLSTTTFTTNPGVALDSTGVSLMTLAGATTKSTSAWAVGHINGGLDTGAIGTSTWYHVYIIQRSDTGVVDLLFSTSASAPTMPANYDRKRRIGSIKTNGSSQFEPWFQYGDEFLWSTPFADIAATNPGISAVTRTLTVPTGVKVHANLTVLGNAATALDAPGAIYISSLDVSDVAAGIGACSIESYTTAAGTMVTGGTVHCWTNTSAQVRSKLQVSASGTVLDITTLGWTDHRGKDM